MIQTMCDLTLLIYLLLSTCKYSVELSIGEDCALAMKMSGDNSV